VSFSFKNYIKKIIAGDIVFSLGKNKRFIFLFHDISEISELHHSDQYSTPVEYFYQIMGYLADKFEFTNIHTLLSQSPKKSTNKPLAAITFDDGFYSVYKNAFPYFKQHTIPFTIFINKQAVCQNQIWFTNLILNKNNDNYWDNFYNAAIEKQQISLSELRQAEIWKIFKYIKKDMLKNLYDYIGIDSGKGYEKTFCNTTDLKEMLNSGLASIHSHSVNHYVLSQCSEDLSYKEIEENKLFVESITGKADEHLSLPFGKKDQYDLRIIKQCRDLGYQYIHTTNPYSFNMKNIQGRPPHILPRIPIANQNIEQIMFMINMSIIKNYTL
jgi:peptidoglycan/xylan/chitin deacetylase (PgdA/CDA1 family)